MTQTAAILNGVFKSYVENDRAIKPLLFFAQENRSRKLSLDLAPSGGSYVKQDGAGLLLDMAPTGQPAEEVSVIASMKWMAYCSPASGLVTLSACEDDAYWEVLEGRYARLAPLADDERPEWVGARLQLAEFYYTGLRTGYVSNVQTGSNIQTLFLSPENEAGTTTAVRIALQNVAPVPLLAAANFFRLFPGYRPDVPNAAKIYVLNYAENIRTNYN